MITIFITLVIVLIYKAKSNFRVLITMSMFGYHMYIAKQTSWEDRESTSNQSEVNNDEDKQNKIKVSSTWIQPFLVMCMKHFCQWIDVAIVYTIFILTIHYTTVLLMTSTC